MFARFGNGKLFFLKYFTKKGFQAKNRNASKSKYIPYILKDRLHPPQPLKFFIKTRSATSPVGIIENLK